MSARDLAELIRSNVKDCIGRNEKVGLLFSGGVDSTVLALVARKFADVTLYLAGTEDSHDMKWGIEAGYGLDLPIKKIAVAQDDVLRSLEDLVSNHGMDNPRWMSTFIAFNIVMPKVEEPVIMCGQGADELFGGYRKYIRCSKVEAEKMMLADQGELIGLEIGMYRAIAKSYGKKFIAPFLEPDIVEFARGLPFEEKITENRNKAILRDAARVLGVPVSIAERPKKAMQYGSGVSKLLKAHLRGQNIDLAGLISRLKAR